MKIVMIILCLVFVFHLTATIINIPADQPTIQAGINVTVNSDTVLVQPGTYVENINFNGKLITVASLFLTTQDTTYISQTIIDGNQNGSVVTFENQEDSTAVLTGFRITNGYALYGGGIRCEINSSPNLTDVTISDNSADSGGGLYCLESNPELNNVIISGNTAVLIGGGLLCYLFADPNLTNVILSNNTANEGGGIYCIYNSSPSLENVTITGNSTGWGNGGGIYCYINSSPSLVNITISGNSANRGGGIYGSSFSLTNVTIANNSAYESGGGIYSWNNSNPIVMNSILWNDSPEEIFIATGSVTTTYTNIQGGWVGEGNINEDPLFLGTGDHPFMLQDLSPCINAGIPDTTGLNLPEFDLAGNPRVYGGRIDMGAYENQNVIVDIDEDLFPKVTKLYQNYPNPFNPTTTISFSIPEESKVELAIYNIKGQRLKSLLNDQIAAGEHSIIWNGEDASGKKVSSGIYLYKLNINGKIGAVKKCIFLK